MECDSPRDVGTYFNASKFRYKKDIRRERVEKKVDRGPIHKASNTPLAVLWTNPTKFKPKIIISSLKN